jgi:hypothetical protein
MVRCATIHTSCWWKWEFPCIMSRLLIIVTCDWSSTSFKTSSSSSSSSIAFSITSRHVILRCLIILRSIVLRLCRVVLRLCVIVWLLCSIILSLRSVIWSWNLIKMWHFFPSHHFGMYPICIVCPFSHQLHSSTIFVVVSH